MSIRTVTGFLAALSLSIGLFVGGCNKEDGGSSGGSGAAGSSTAPSASGGKQPKVAYITNGVDPFWNIAEKGARAGAAKYGANLSVVMPNGSTEQKQKVEDLLIRGVDGIAISPIDAENQTPMINDAAKKTKVITHDSDAPKSDRLMYIGMNNYDAGRMAGQLIKEAIPDGGKVAIFVGRLEQDNARLRRQGVIDELLGRSNDSTRNDPPGGELKGDKYTIVATLTDQFDRAKAKSNAEDMIVAHPDLKAMVGLFAYNPPNCLEALKKNNKVGQIALIGFDEQEATLQAIKDGFCHGTVVQNPYMYGFESVHVLTSLAKGDNSVIPEGKFMNIPARQIRKDNVDAFWADLKEKVK